MKTPLKKTLAPRLLASAIACVMTASASARDGDQWQCTADGGQWLCSGVNKQADATKATNQLIADRPTAAASRYDWVSEADLPAALHDHECRQCQGRYVDPLRSADRNQKPEKSELRAQAGDSEILLKENTARFSGGVSISQGYRRLSGTEFTVNNNTGEAAISGNIEIREPGLLLRGERAAVNTRDNTLVFDDALFVLHEQHFHGSAQQLKRDTDGVISGEEAEITYCSPEQHQWALNTREVEIKTEEGYAITRGTKLKVRDVPVLYLPYLAFPIGDKRRSGVLWPDLGTDSGGGIDIALPLYWNIAPNYDLLYTPRHIQNRGLSNQFNARYLGRYSGLWSFNGAYLHKDKQYHHEYPDLEDHKRWLINVTQRGHYGAHWYSRVNYSRASDVNYLKDLQSDSLNNRRETNLLQQGALGYVSMRWRADLNVSQYQSLANDISDNYKKLPQLTWRYLATGEAFSINPIAFAQYSNFDINDESRSTGQRLYSEIGANYPMLWTAGFFTPTIKYRQLNYALDRLGDELMDDNPSVGAPLASLDGGLYFDRDTELLNKPLVQTIEPRLYYLYSPYRKQQGLPDFDTTELPFSYGQLYRDSRFSGHDRLDDADQISAGITSRFIDRHTGREYFNASLGQTFYLQDRQVRRVTNDPAFDSSSSEVVAEVIFYPNARLDVLTNLAWDPQDDRVNNANVQVSYRPWQRTLFNVGYTYRRPIESLAVTQPVTEQTHLSAWLPFGQSNWSFFASWNYSLEANSSVEDMVGLEYDSCCWKFRVLHLRYFDTVSGQYVNPDDPTLEREHSTQVQIVLKGLGGFGSRVSSILEDMIRGYKDSDF